MMKDNEKAKLFYKEAKANLAYKRFYDSLVLFNKSLCHLPKGSENLAKVFTSRALVYLEIKEVDKCLENVQMARNHECSNEIQLTEIEERCQKLKENQPKDSANDPKSFFKLSYSPHERNPSVVNCVEVKKNEKFGRHVITNRDLNPGDIIAIEEPIFKAIFDRSRYERCSNCLNTNMLSLIPCDGCNFGELKNIIVVKLIINFFCCTFQRCFAIKNVCQKHKNDFTSLNAT
jgi:SET and MYND domain-containing protein 4